MTSLLLGIDVGTTSCKAAAVNIRGKKIAEAACEYPTQRPQPGWAEQNPQDWLDALTVTFRTLTHHLGDNVQNLVGGSISAHGPTMVLINSEGKALKPAPTWQDYRSIPQGERLLEASIGHDWLGLGPLRTGMAAKLLWAKENWPVAFDDCRWLMGVKEYIAFWLTGQIGSEPSSGPGARNWPEDVFHFIGLPSEKLPPVYPITHQIGSLRKEVAQASGLPFGLPIYLGLNDGASSTLGTGASEPGDACISLGTNGVGRLVLDRPFNPERGLQMDAFFWPFIPERWVVGGMTITGGSCLDWIRTCLGSIDFDMIVRQAGEIPPGSNGVLFLPYLMGRGTPHPNERARAAFLQLDISSGSGEMTRAVMEGVAFALRDIFSEFERMGLPVGDIRITGGGAQIPLWRQIVADVIDRNLIIAGGDATLGASIVAAVASSIFSDFSEAVKEMVEIRDEHHPIPTNVARYNEVYTHYQTYVARLGYNGGSEKGGSS